MKVKIQTTVFLWSSVDQQDLTFYCTEDGSKCIEYQAHSNNSRNYKFITEVNNTVKELIDLTVFSEEEIFQMNLVWEGDFDIYFLLAIQKYALQYNFNTSKHLKKEYITLEY